MGVFGGLMGAAGGFLQTGSPVGALGGFLGGMFGGGGSEQSSNMYIDYAALNPQQAALLQGAGAQLPGLMSQLAPGAQNEMVNRLQGQFSDVLGGQVSDAFNLQSGRARANMARTGGGPSSIMNSQLAQLGHERGKAMNMAEMQATQLAEGVGAGRFAQNLGATQALGGLVNQTTMSRLQTGQHGQLREIMGNNQNTFAGIGQALSDNSSYFNQNRDAFGAFGAPIFGGGGSANPTQQQGNAAFNNYQLP